ncbi:hypothetical protein [Meiothermus rufus]|uniref:hypothetical protein n=1 Tax=Meiothermus rufus TaxID=604332 RepID=UPI00041F262F|nr:hypothetical protein [Meiothermus rufus]
MSSQLQLRNSYGDFVRDSFDPEAGLNTVNFGERVLVVEQSSQIVLAVVVQGTPPPQLQERLQEAILEVHTRFAGDIRNFSGDTHPFQEARPILEPLLETRYIQPERRPQYIPWLALGVLLLGLGGFRPAGSLINLSIRKSCCGAFKST